MRTEKQAGLERGVRVSQELCPGPCGTGRRPVCPSVALSSPEASPRLLGNVRVSSPPPPPPPSALRDKAGQPPLCCVVALEMMAIDFVSEQKGALGTVANHLTLN